MAYNLNSPPTLEQIKRLATKNKNDNDFNSAQIEYLAEAIVDILAGIQAINGNSNTTNEEE